MIKGAPTREGRPLRMAPCGCRAPPRATCSSRKVPRRAASGVWTTVGVRALLPGAAVGAAICGGVTCGCACSVGVRRLRSC